jgi:mRNA interferase RelE/StbE
VNYRVVITSSAEREIQKLPREIQGRIDKAISTLETNPRPQRAKKLQGRDEYRIRAGDYRILYSINDEIVTITVVQVGHRRDVYR